MSSPHFIVATAGHVDHGKSALVKALTGTDPDRLPEEKARGITIDLGFAALDVVAPSGVRFHVGIVDVPGHEDFVKNMVAGVAAADLALLVVAADDGWMPQTEEHVQVLTYFGIRRAVVALTKADTVADPSHAVAAVRHRLRGTPFEYAPIVPTSIVSGHGIDRLKRMLVQVLAEAPQSRDIGKPRLPVDRVFTLTGIGTVVTGTLTGGALQKGQSIVVQPSGRTTRIRRMQSHNRDVESSSPGRRIALNLPDLGADDVRRGDVVTLVAHGRPSTTLDVVLEISARATRSIRNGIRLRAHYGSANVGARVVLIAESELSPGSRALAQLRLDSPALLFDGDRFTVRDWAEQSTLAGGIVLDADASRRGCRQELRRQYLSRRANAPNDVAAWIESLLAREDFAFRSRLLVKSGFSHAEIDGAIQRMIASGTVSVAGDAFCLAATFGMFRQRAVEAVDGYHRQRPDRLGMPMTDLRAQLGSSVANGVFDAFVESLCASGFTRDGSVVRRMMHRPTLPAPLEAAGSVLRATLAAKPLNPPSRGALAPDAIAVRALRFLVETGEAVEVSAEVILPAETVDAARETVVTVIRERGVATLGDIRARLGCSRRILIPLLEYLDRTGVTVRDGDRRRLRR